MNYVVYILLALTVTLIFFLWHLLSRCREDWCESQLENSQLLAGYDAIKLENRDLLTIIADHDKELAEISLERDELMRKLNHLTSLKVIDMARVRNGARQL